MTCSSTTTLEDAMEVLTKMSEYANCKTASCWAPSAIKGLTNPGQQPQSNQTNLALIPRRHLGISITLARSTLADCNAAPLQRECTELPLDLAFYSIFLHTPFGPWATQTAHGVATLDR